jgi:hypothetical protein
VRASPVGLSNPAVRPDDRFQGKRKVRNAGGKRPPKTRKRAFEAPAVKPPALLLPTAKSPASTDAPRWTRPPFLGYFALGRLPGGHLALRRCYR